MDAANQIFIFLVCVLVGVASGVVYELFYILRKLCGDVAGIVFDVLFFLAVRPQGASLPPCCFPFLIFGYICTWETFWGLYYI